MQLDIFRKMTNPAAVVILNVVRNTPVLKYETPPEPAFLFIIVVGINRCPVLYPTYR